jgi:hypothetical protein
MDAQVAMIVQNLKTLPADAANVEMDYKLIDHLLQQGQIPSAATNALDFLVRQAGPAHAETVWISEVWNFVNRLRPVGFINCAEPSFDSVSVISTGVHPKNNRCAGMNKFAGDHDFVAAPRFKGPRSGCRLATRQQGRRHTGHRKRVQLRNPANDNFEHPNICPRKHTAVKQKSHIVM